MIYKLNFSAIFKKIISAHMENMPNGEKRIEILHISVV